MAVALPFLFSYILFHVVTGQEYEATLQYQVYCGNPELVRAVNGLIICGPPQGIMIFSDPLETGQPITKLATVPANSQGTFEVITYPERNNELYMIVTVLYSWVMVYHLNKASILAGTPLIPVFQQQCYTDTNVVVIDYDHRIAIASGTDGLCRYNMTDPQNVRMLSKTSALLLGPTVESWCCSPLAVFDNRLAIADRMYGNNLLLYNMSTIRPTLIRSYLNWMIRTLWKHPSEEYILGTRQAESSIVNSNQVFFRVHLGTGLFQWYKFGDTARRIIQLTNDTIGVLSDKSDRIYLWKFWEPATVPESIRIVGMHQDFLIDRGRLIASSFYTPRLGFYNITEKATGRAPTWLEEASMRMSGSQYLARNPLRLLTPVDVKLGGFPITLQSKHLQTIDITGAKFVFAPISYIISNLAAGAQVQVWRDGSWVVCAIGQTFQQAEVDAGLVQVSVQNATSTLDMYAELRPTNWLGGSAPTVTMMGLASFSPTTFMSTASITKTSTLAVPTTSPQLDDKDAPETSRPGTSIFQLFATSIPLQILTAGVLLMFTGLISLAVYRRFKKNPNAAESKNEHTAQTTVPASTAASTLNIVPTGSNQESSSIFKTVVDPRTMTTLTYRTFLPGFQTTTSGFHTYLNTRMTGQATLIPDANYLFFPAFAQYQNGVAYRMLKQIGGGGMATVWLCDVIEPNLRAAAEGTFLIAKVMREASTSSVEMEDRRTQAWRQEISIGYFLRKHPNIVKTIGYSYEPYPTILLKFYELGSMEALIHSKGAQIPGFQWSSKTRWELFRDCCQGLHFMHQNMVAHRDIKPDNVLLSRDTRSDRIVGILSDLGVAQILNQQNVVSAFQVQNLNAVTVRYAGPEVMQRFRMKITSISQPEEGLAGDLYALAIMLFEMLVLDKCWK